jgi:adenosyl cobinamide kinase/adenosyl cobinamide phosphate guanylyltransferase
VGLTVLLGGARSGKSSLAVQLAAGRPAPVVLVVTAEAGDAEMEERIARHRAERPAGWATVEAPVDLAAALAAADPDATVILDCLTLWLSNLRERSEPEILDAARRAAGVAAARPGLTIVVTNEVGSGIVPFDPEVRRWRDLLGTVNAIWVEAADRAALVVAGRALPLLPAEAVLGG